MSTDPLLEIAALARRLKSSEARERQQAQTDLQALIAEDVCRIKSIQNLVKGSFIVYIVVSIFLIAWGAVSKPGISIFFMYPIMFAFFGVNYLLSRWKNRVARTIAAFDIPQAIGPLIEVYYTSRFARSPQIKAALIRLLPRLQAEDTSALTPSHLSMLHRILYNANYPLSDSPTADTALALAILRALEQIGDGKAIPRVEKLAHSARNSQVRLAAQECLPFLQLRVEQANVEQTLLRADAQPVSPDTLLRPTTFAMQTEPQQLLRASHTENDADSA